MSCNRVNGSSVSANLPPYNYVPAVCTFSERVESQCYTRLPQHTSFQQVTLLWCHEVCLKSVVKDLGFVVTTVVLHSEIVGDAK